LGPNVIIPNYAFSNSVAVGFTVPDGTGVFNPNGIFSTNLVNITSPSAFGITMLISNVLNLNVVIINGPQTWASVAMSADGSHLVAVVNGGLIYASTNSGNTWFATSAPSNNWSAIAISADGSQLVAAVNGGLLYTSSDSGASWSSASVPAAGWNAVATSADGADLVAVVNGGAIYTEQSPAKPQTIVVPPLAIEVAGTNVILSWPAGGAYVLQQNSSLAGTGWQDLHPTATVTNGQNQVTLPISSKLSFYRLRD